MYLSCAGFGMIAILAFLIWSSLSMRDLTLALLTLLATTPAMMLLGTLHSGTRHVTMISGANFNFNVFSVETWGLAWPVMRQNISQQWDKHLLGSNSNNRDINTKVFAILLLFITIVFPENADIYLLYLFRMSLLQV